MFQLTASQRDAVVRSDFFAFAQAALNFLEPDTKFELNWHLEAICQTLVESNGKRTRKFINAPPRSLKSFLLSVAWVAYKLAGC
jgi:hypothetical protein